jgi:hypothetical protein
MATAKTGTSAGINLIEIGEAKAQKSVIVRDGKRVATPTVIEEQVDFLVTALPGATRTEVPRVISQSPQAGSFVKRGTKVNLVYAPPTKVPIRIFDKSLVALADRPITDVAPLLEDPLVHEVITTYETPDEVPEAKRKQVVELVSKEFNVDVSEENFDQAFGTLRAGLAFK